MKTAFVSAALVVILALGGHSLAVTHGDAGAEDRLQSLPPADLLIILSGFAEKENLEALLQKLKDPDPFVRVEVIQALGEIEQEQSLVSVCECLNDENLYVRAYAAEALGRIGQIDIPFTLSRLLPSLDDPSPYVRAMMLAALGELQDVRAADSIRKLLQDEDESVRDMAAWALDNIEKSQ